MSTPIFIFEDKKVQNLHPLTYTRPVYDLRCGILTLKEKIEKYFPGRNIILHTRDYLIDSVKQNFPDNEVNRIPDNVEEMIFINGRTIADSGLSNNLVFDETETAYYSGGELVAIKLNSSNLENAKNHLTDLEEFFNSLNVTKKELDVNVVEYPWHLVHANGSEIVKDYNLLTSNIDNKIQGKIYDGVNIVEKDNIYIGEGSKIKPGVVLDAEGGPIFIGKNVTVFPNSVIEGPCYIGDGSKIKVGAKIYENTSIGPVCKVGGEVEESIIHSYSNKQHDGFLGHAYLGSWVNLGADTNNSDLKNNYGNVKVFINDKPVDSGSMFVGLTMGDHSKSGINTMFNTGTVVGVGCNVYGADFPPKYIPSFSWGGSESMTTYKLDKCMEVAKRVMARRDVEFTEADEKIFKTVFELTKDERAIRKFPEEV